ncbi:MAG: hypothetical protein EBR62_04240, partial [Verrucomicrobia bacterium]|nr:hypothetical protein [Verrucomicrobiota bacterium]
TVNGINSQVTNVFSGGTVGNGSSGMGATLDLAALTPTNSIVLAGGALTGSAIDPSKVSGYGFIQGTMTGTNALTVNTTGALTLYTSGTFSGGTTLTAGTLNLMNSGSMGTGTFTWNGGTLDNTTTGWVTPTNAFTLGGNVTAQGTQGLTLNGATTIAAPRTVTVNAGGIWFGGTVTLTSALTKSGPGILGLNAAANTGAGGINVLAGTLYTDTTVTTAPSFGTGPVAISAGANAIIVSKPAADQTFANAFSGAGNLYVSPRSSGTATLTLSGDMSAFTGFLSVGVANGNGKVVLPTSLNSTALVRLESGATIYQGTGTFANTFQLSGGTTGETYGQIRTDGATFSGPIILLANTTIGNQASGAGTFSGQIIGNYGLTRQGTGAGGIVLSGNNTFTGGLTISASSNTTFNNANAAGSGTLNLSASGATGTVGAGLANFKLGGLAGVTGSIFSDNSTVASLTTSGGLSGSNTVFTSALGAAAVGQPINGAGISAGTRIASIVSSAPTIAALGGDSGSSLVFASATSGLLVGMPVTGTGVATGAKVTALVAAPTVSSIIGDSGSNLVFAAATTGLQVGMPVTGTGVATGAKVTALASAPTVSSVVGDAGTDLVFATATTGLQVGMPVTGTGVATGAKVTQLIAAPTVNSIVGDSGASVVFAPATTGLVVGMPVSGTGVATGAKVTAIAAAPTLVVDATGALLGSTDVPVTSTAGLVVGMPVTGAALAAGTKIVAINGNVVTLSAATTADLAGADTLAGTAAVTLSAANTAAASGDLTGSAAAKLSATNTAAVSGNLAGSAYATLSAANTSAASGTLAGTAYATLSVANTGAVSGTVSGSAYVTLSRNLTADATGVATVSGNAAIGSGNTNTAFAGVISGAGSVSKVGTGTLTLSGQNTFTGGLDINAGGVTLDFTTNATNILPSTGSVTLNGGTLTLFGKSGITDSQTLSSPGLLTVASGGNKIVFSQNGATGLLLTVGNLARNVGATLDITAGGTPSAANGLVVTNANVNGILGAWATVGGADWAVANAGTGVSGFAAYTTFVTDGTNLSTDNSLLTDGATTTSTTGLAANSLKINTTLAGQALDLGGQPLTLNSGGLLFVGANGYEIKSVNAGASLTPYASQEIIVQQNGAGTLTISVPVVDNGAAVSLVKAGTGELILSGTNTFTGNIYLNGGTLTASANANLGAIPTNATANNLNIAGGTLKTTADLSLDAKRGVVTSGNGATFAPTSSTLTVAGPISGSGSLTLTGTANGKLVLGSANTYSGSTTVTNGTLVLNNTAALGTSGALTVSGGAVGFGAGVTSLSLTNLGTSGGTITLTTADTTPAAVALSVNAAAGVPATFAGNFAGLGSLALSGNGSVFTLSGANTLSGGISVAANSGLNVNSAGALGTGTLSLGAGTAVLGFTTTLDNTTANPVALSTNPAQAWAGDFTFTGTRNLNLGTGAVTLSGNRVVTVNGSPITYTGDAGILTVGGAIGGTGTLTKAGTGRLVLGGSNTFTGNVTVTGGTLVVSSDAGLGDSANAVILGGATTATSSNSTIQPAGLGIAATFTSARAITLGGTYNVFDVAQGATFTPTAVFTLGNTSGSGLVKTGGGTLVLGTAGQFTGTGSISYPGAQQQVVGGIRVDQGMLVIANSTAVAPNTILAVNNSYNATIALSSGVSLSNNVVLNTLTVNAGRFGNVALTALAGVNTLAGQVSMQQDATIGVADGATLNLTGGIALNGHILDYITSGTGVLNVSGAPIASLHSWNKLGTGTLNISTTIANSVSAVPSIYEGTVSFSGAAGTMTTGQTQNWKFWGPSRLFLDNSTAFLANRLGGANGLTFAGGTFEYTAHATAYSTETTTGGLTFAWGNDAFIVNTTAAGSAITFGSLTGPQGGATLAFRTGGTNAAYGTALNRVLFTTAPGVTNGILAPNGAAYVIDANGVNFATYNTTGYATGANVGGIQAFQAYNNATVSSTTVSGSPVVTVGSTFGLAVGMPVNGAGIPEGATIAAILTPTTYQLSTAATAAGTNNLQYQYTNLNTAGVTGSTSDVIRLAASGNAATGNASLLTRSAAGVLINSASPVTLNASGFGTLTLSNGGLLATGGTVGTPVTHVIGSNLVVLDTSTTYDLNLAVDANTTLDVQGVLRNGYNITKSLPGTLQFSAKQYF